MSDTPPTAQPTGDDQPPSIPDHALLHRIGAGSYGEVWLARNVMGALRAVKIVHRRSFDSDRPYEREFAGLQKFEPISRRHESQLDILHVGRDDARGCFYYVMELADPVNSEPVISRSVPDVKPTPTDSLNTDPLITGYSPRTLRSDLAHQGRLPVAECIRLGLALATALEHLHSHALVHRDIKPSNIVFVEGQPKLADIGLVTDADATMTCVGTEGYLPPEGPGAPQADLFALGKVLYEISTGRDRKEFPDLPADFARLPDDAKEELREFNAVVLKACQPRPSDRYASAAALRDALLLLQAGKSVRRQQTLEHQLARLRTWGAWAGAVAVFLVAGFLLWQWRRGLESRAKTELARAESRAAVEKANATRRELLLREVQMARQGARTNGWFDASWDKLREAARLKVDDDARTQAAACLSGPDAKLVADPFNAGAFSLAFSPDGQTLLCAGVTDSTGTNAARLLQVSSLFSHFAGGEGRRAEGDTQTAAHDQSQLLPVFGDAVAAWQPDGATNGTPVLFQPGDSNHFVLRDALTGRVLRNFQLEGHPWQGNENHPVLALTSDARLATASVESRAGVPPAPSGGISPPDDARGETPRQWAGETPALLGHLAVWDTTTGRTLFQTNEPASALAFSPDGRALAVGDGEGRVRVFSVPDFALLAEFPIARVRINCFAFTRDPIVPRTGPLTNAWWLAVGDAGGTIRIYRTHTREQLRTCSGSAFDVFAMAFRVDGVVLASAGRSEIHVWDAATGSRLLTVPSKIDFTRSLLFAPAGDFFCAANEEKFNPALIASWRLEMHRGVEIFRGLATQVSRVWLSPDGQHLAALEHSWRLAVWDLRSGKLLRVFETPAGDTADNAAVAFAADGRRLAFCSGSEARLWNIDDGQTERRWILPWGGFGESLCFDQRGRLLLLRRESDIRKERPMPWRLRCLREDEDCPVLRQQEDVAEWRPETTALVQNGKYFVIWGRRGPDWQIRLFEGETAEQLHRFDFLNAGSKSPGIDPTGRWLLHDCPGGSILRPLPDWHPATPLSHGYAVSPDAQIFARVVPGGYALVFGRSTNAPALAVQVDVRVSDSAWPVFSHDGKRVAWGLENGSVIVFTRADACRHLKACGIEVDGLDP